MGRAANDDKKTIAPDRRDKPVACSGAFLLPPAHFRRFSSPILRRRAVQSGNSPGEPPAAPVAASAHQGAPFSPACETRRRASAQPLARGAQRVVGPLEQGHPGVHRAGRTRLAPAPDRPLVYGRAVPSRLPRFRTIKSPLRAGSEPSGLARTATGKPLAGREHHLMTRGVALPCPEACDR